MSKVDKKYKLNRILFDILLIATSFVVTYCITDAEFQFGQFITFAILLSIIWLIASYFSSIYLFLRLHTVALRVRGGAQSTETELSRRFYG